MLRSDLGSILGLLRLALRHVARGGPATWRNVTDNLETAVRLLRFAEAEAVADQSDAIEAQVVNMEAMTPLAREGEKS